MRSPYTIDIIVIVNIFIIKISGGYTHEATRLDRFFQAVNGRNPSIQEMAEAAQKGEFVRETPKQTVEVTENCLTKRDCRN